MHPDWARALRDQCAAAGVPLFFKQWGAFAPSVAVGGVFPAERRGQFVQVSDDECYAIPHDMPTCKGGISGTFAVMHRVRKKESGRLLDRTEHSAFPA